MKTQHFNFRYFSNTDLSIKILFSQDNCILHSLSKDFPLFLIYYKYAWFTRMFLKTSYLSLHKVLHKWFEYYHRANVDDWLDNIFR